MPARGITIRYLEIHRPVTTARIKNPKKSSTTLPTKSKEKLEIVWILTFVIA
jgi:hypothetical protein